MPDKAQQLDNFLRDAVAYEIVPAAARDPRFEPWNIDYWREWLLEPDKSEETVRKYTRPLNGAFQDASWRNDLPAMARILGILDFGYRYCSEEPFLTPYELTLMFMSYMIVERHMIDGRLERGLADLDRIEECLRNGDARRAELKMIPRPNSELRLNLLGLRAALLGDPAAATQPSREEVQVIADQYWQIADELVPKLEDIPEVRRIGLLTNMARLELYVCKLAYLVDRGLFAEAVARFNQRYAADLSVAEPVHDVSLSIEVPQTAWYWDLEVWKHLHLPSKDSAALQQCMHFRKSTLQLNYGKDAIDCLLQYWQRQADAA